MSRQTMPMAVTTRDPLSVRLDPAARRLLDRAYAAPGTWQATVLADPDMAMIRYANGLGIYPLSRDMIPGGEAKTRWARAFMRALYYQHKWFSRGGGPGWRDTRRTAARETGALVVEVGRAMPALGVRPAGRAVRVRLMSGGQAKARAVEKMSGDRMWADGGPRHSDPSQRDW